MWKAIHSTDLARDMHFGNTYQNELERVDINSLHTQTNLNTVTWYYHRAYDNGRSSDKLRSKYLFETCYSVKKSCQIFTTCSVTITKWLELEDLELLQKMHLLTSSLEDYLPSKKRILSVAVMEKWIRDNDRTLCTASWLSYEKVDREYVSVMKCSVCIRYKHKLVGCRNFSSAFIDGSKTFALPLSKIMLNPTCIKEPC